MPYGVISLLLLGSCATTVPTPEECDAAADLAGYLATYAPGADVRFLYARFSTCDTPAWRAHLLAQLSAPLVVDDEEAPYDDDACRSPIQCDAPPRRAAVLLSRTCPNEAIAWAEQIAATHGLYREDPYTDAAARILRACEVDGNAWRGW